MPVDEAVLSPGLAVFDMVTRETPLITRARTIGCPVILGKRMLLFQALKQFTLFTEQEAPKQEMEAALEKELASTHA